MHCYRCVVRLSVCLLGTWVSYAKQGSMDQDAVWGLTQVDPGNHCMGVDIHHTTTEMGQF